MINCIFNNLIKQNRLLCHKITLMLTLLHYAPTKIDFGLFKQADLKVCRNVRENGWGQNLNSTKITLKDNIK